MRRIVRTSALLLLLPLGARGQTSTPDAAELERLLREFLAGASRSDAAAHERFWAEELVYTGSAGRRVGKADILRDLKAAPAPVPGDPRTTYSAEDVRIRLYGETAVVAFRLVGATERSGKTEVASYLDTGTFVKRDGSWRAVSWQATRMPPPEEKAADRAADEAEIRTVQMRQAEAWNRHDAKAYAALFAEDADVVNVLGWWWRGRAELESKLGAAFAFVFAESTLSIAEVHTRFLAPDVAVTHVRWTMEGARTPPGVPAPKMESRP